MTIDNIRLYKFTFIIINMPGVARGDVSEKAVVVDFQMTLKARRFINLSDLGHADC